MVQVVQLHQGIHEIQEVRVVPEVQDLQASLVLLSSQGYLGFQGILKHTKVINNICISNEIDIYFCLVQTTHIRIYFRDTQQMQNIS